MTTGEDKQKLNEALKEAGIWSRYDNVTMDSLFESELPKYVDEAFAKVLAFNANLEENVKAGKGLILAGTPGTLKTTMAVAILRNWIELGNAGMLINMDSLIDNLFTMRELNKEEWARYEQRIRRIPLLLLDDMGQENTDAKWVLAKVNSIITERYNKMLSTIITTNMSRQELAKTYADRIIDRLRQCNEFILIKGESMRDG